VWSRAPTLALSFRGSDSEKVTLAKEPAVKTIAQGRPDDPSDS
jgi:hypothetical protein